MLPARDFELLHEVVPHLSRLAIMADVGDTDALLEMAVDRADEIRVRF